MAGPRLLYDADCAFCTRVVRLARRMGLTVTVLPLQSADLAALGVSAERAESEIPFVGADGAVSYGAPAIARALTTGNRCWRAIGRAMEHRPLRPVAAAIYRIVSRHRSRLPFGTTACAAPARAPRTTRGSGTSSRQR